MSLTVRIRKQMGDFSLEADFTAQQETLGLLGASGCGKSVTLKCIAGILRPDEGLIQLDGQTLYDSAAGICLPPQKRGVGYLVQSYALFPNMTVRQNIAAAVTDRRLRRSETEEKLRQFRLEEIAELKPPQLSGGQQQRTALARILASRPLAGRTLLRVGQLSEIPVGAGADRNAGAVPRPHSLCHPRSGRGLPLLPPGVRHGSG